MAYSIQVLDNGRIAARGMARINNGVRLEIDSDETIPLSIDWTGFLGSDTIASVVNDASGATISGAANTTTGASFKVSAASQGYIQHRITTAAGTIKEIPIYLNSQAGFIGGRDCYE